MDFREYFYDLKKQLAGKIFSEEALSSDESRRKVNENVDDIIRECYKDILIEVLQQTGLDSFEEAKRYVIDSHGNMVQQVQDLMQNVRNIISANTAQITDGEKLLREADRLIGQTDRMLVVQKLELEALKAQFGAFIKESDEKKAREQEEARRQEEAREAEQAQSDPMLESVDRVLASADEVLAEQGKNLTALESQMKAFEEAKRQEEQKKQEEARRQAEQAKPSSMLESANKLLASVDILLANTDEILAIHERNLAELKNQLSGYITTHPSLEEAKASEGVAAKTGERGQADPFRLSDEDMEAFNSGVQKVMESMNGKSKDKKPSIEDLFK